MANRYWVGGAGTWNSTNTANWSDTSGGAGGFSAPTSADDVYFDAASNAGNYTVTTTNQMFCRNFNVAGPAAGTLTFSNTTNSFNIFGSVVHAASGVAYGSSLVLLYSSTATGNTVTTNGFSFNVNNNFNGVGGEWTLQDDLNTTTNRAVNLINGSLNLNNNIINCGLFGSNFNNVRELHFGTGKINVTGNNTAVWNVFGGSGLTVSGSRRVEFSYAGAVGTRTVAMLAVVNEANALDFYILSGTDIIQTSGTVRYAGTVDFTGFNGTYNNLATGNITIFGDLVLDAGMTLSASNSGFTFAKSSGTQTVTTNGITLDMPVTVNSAGATTEFADALTLGATRALSLTSGTVEFLAGSTNTAGTFVISGSPSVMLQSSIPGTQYTLSQASGTVNASNMTVSDSNVTGGATWNAFVSQGNVDGGNNTGWDFFSQIGRYIYTRRKNKRILL